jgi:membrane-associated protein
MLSLVLAAGSLLDPKHLIDTVGLAGIFAIIFAESGLLVGFFLPGDALLFTAGFFASHPASVPDSLHLPIVPLILGVWVAAVAGDQVGFLIGQRVGPTLFQRPDSRFFKQEYVERAHAFFDDYGSRTIVIARFVPIVRTFTPVVAGAGRMEYRTFVRWNVVGGTLWAFGLPLLGYYLGQVDVIANHIELAAIGVAVISVLPIAFEIRRNRRARKPA